MHFFWDQTPVFEMMGVFDSQTRRVRALHLENRLRPSCLGSIFAGRVISVQSGLNAAFVDIGGSKNAFLRLKPEMTLKNGSMVLCNVVKDAYADKGPEVSLEPALPGAYTVLKPLKSALFVSHKLSDRYSERSELISAIEHRGYGAILRTASRGVDTSRLLEEYRQLCGQWEGVQRAYRMTHTPSLLWRPGVKLPLVKMLETHASEISHYHALTDEQVTLFRELGVSRERIRRHKDPMPLYRQLGVPLEALLFEDDVHAEGIRIRVDRTEALTVFDVNSGRYQMEGNPSEAAYGVNSIAAQRILEYIELHALSGILLIDFVDMASEQIERFLQALQSMGYTKRQGISLEGFTKLGILELSRKRTRPPLRDYMLYKGSTAYWTLEQIYEALLVCAYHQNTNSVRVSVAPEVYEALAATNGFARIVDALPLAVSWEQVPTHKDFSIHSLK